MSADRSYRCAHCRGVVAIPDRVRRISLETVRRHHDESCPGQLPKVKR